jgi:hypothetical protein
LLTAIGVGLVVEILLLAGGTAVGSRFPQPWDERVWAATQEPAYHLVDWLARVHRPGFEEQGVYFVLSPIAVADVERGFLPLPLTKETQSGYRYCRVAAHHTK